MNLAFSTVLNGKPTYFIDKIWTSLIHHYGLEESHAYEFNLVHIKKFGTSFSCPKLPIPKIHTIRKVSDKLNRELIQAMNFSRLASMEQERFKPGTKIHFIINNRTKDRFQFAPVIPVVSRQYISFFSCSFSKYPIVSIYTEKDLKVNFNKPSKIFYPGNHFEYTTGLDELAKNDGFDSWEDFLEYFKGSGLYKIIHWTNKLY